jgi:hypothetical protein
MYAWIGGECLDLFQLIFSRSKTKITVIFKKKLWFWLAVGLTAVNHCDFGQRYTLELKKIHRETHRDS